MPEEYRGQCDDIARQLVYSDIGQKVNLVFGGGKQNFVKKSDGGMEARILLSENKKYTLFSLLFRKKAR